MSEQSNETRIAVAESRLDHHAQLLENNQELTAKIVDRLDSHIQQSQARDERIQENLAGVTLAVTELSGVVGEATNAIRELTPIVQANNKSLLQWDAVKTTLVKVVAAIVLLVSGGWAVFEFVIDHRPTIEIKGK